MKVTFTHSVEARECEGDFNTRFSATFDSHTWEDLLDDVIDEILVPGLMSMGFAKQSIADAFWEFGEELDNRAPVPSIPKSF